MVVTLHELIGKFDGWEEIPNLFEDIAQEKLDELLLPHPESERKWTSKIKLRLGPDHLKLAWSDLDTGTLIVAPPNLEEAVFTVLNANGAEKSDQPYLSSVI